MRGPESARASVAGGSRWGTKMAGVEVPEHIVVKPFGADAIDPTYITLPIPIVAGIGADASFNAGFPAATMTDPLEGGVPPYGQDMNGILYMLSAYCALLQAGQRVNWDSDASDAFTGYAIGAEVASVDTPGRVWTNLIDGNTADPDDDDTGWAANDPLYATVAPSAGQHNNYVLPGASDYALDVDTTAGNIDFTGFVAQRNGQKLSISNTGANLLQVLASNAGSTAANQVRSATDLAVIQNQTLTVQYFASLNRWLII